MVELLEISMLVCFGLSWPVSLIRNIRSRSAESMNLSFILLITAGYIAGITAKVMQHQLGIVLLAYIANLLVVSCNIVVYFINRNYDRQKTMQLMKGRVSI